MLEMLLGKQLRDAARSKADKKVLVRRALSRRMCAVVRATNFSYEDIMAMDCVVVHNAMHAAESDRALTLMVDGVRSKTANCERKRSNRHRRNRSGKSWPRVQSRPQLINHIGQIRNRCVRTMTYQ